MAPDISLLVWSVFLCFAQTLISAVTAQTQVGLATLLGNRENMPALTGLAGRAHRAHRNMLENLPLFAALVLVAHVAGQSNAMTALGAALFFWARVAYAVIYLWGGVPGLRTGAWAVSVVGLAIIFIQVV